MKIVLVVAYLSAQGAPSIQVYEMPDMATCRSKAVQTIKHIRVGSARCWCQGVKP